jgi:hypothetical protein
VSGLREEGESEHLDSQPAHAQLSVHNSAHYIFIQSAAVMSLTENQQLEENLSLFRSALRSPRIVPISIRSSQEIRLVLRNRCGIECDQAVVASTILSTKYVQFFLDNNVNKEVFGQYVQLFCGQFMSNFLGHFVLK